MHLPVNGSKSIDFKFRKCVGYGGDKGRRAQNDKSIEKGYKIFNESKDIFVVALLPGF
jgi:hypothetical protein